MRKILKFCSFLINPIWNRRDVMVNDNLYIFTIYLFRMLIAMIKMPYYIYDTLNNIYILYSYIWLGRLHWFYAMFAQCRIYMATRETFSIIYLLRQVVDLQSSWIWIIWFDWGWVLIFKPKISLKVQSMPRTFVVVLIQTQRY